MKSMKSTISIEYTNCIDFMDFINFVEFMDFVNYMDVVSHEIFYNNLLTSKSSIAKLICKTCAKTIKL